MAAQTLGIEADATVMLRVTEPENVAVTLCKAHLMKYDTSIHLCRDDGVEAQSLPSRSLREDITGRSGHRPPGLRGRHNRGSC